MSHPSYMTPHIQLLPDISSGCLLMVVRLARLLIQRCGEILTPFLQKRLIGILAGNEAEDGRDDGKGACKRRKTNATKKQNGKKAEEDGEDNDDGDDDDETEDGGRDAADKAAVAGAGDVGGGLLRGSDALSAVIKVGG